MVVAGLKVFDSNFVCPEMMQSLVSAEFQDLVQRLVSLKLT